MSPRPSPVWPPPTVTVTTEPLMWIFSTPPCGEQAAGQLVDRALPQLAGRLLVALVAHARQRAVRLEPEDGGVAGGLRLEDGDRLTHRWRHATHGAGAP